MEKEVLKKISKKDIKVNLFFITLLLVYIINFDHINDLANYLLKLEPFFLRAILFFPTIIIIFAPFTLAHAEWLDLSKKIEYNYDKIHLIIGRLFYISIYAFFVIFIIGYKSEGFFDAFIYTISNPNWTKIVVIALLSFYFTKDLNHSIHNRQYELSGYLIGFMCFSFFWSLYYKFGLDDGCVTVGGDPLFGGGGEIECDDDYQQVKDRKSEIASKNSFTSNAFFAAELFLMIIISNVFILIGYIKSKRKFLK